MCAVVCAQVCIQRVVRHADSLAGQNPPLRHYSQLTTDTAFRLFPVVFDALAVPGPETISLVRDLATIAVSAGLVVASAHSAFVLRALTKLSFSVALANLTELLRPSLGLDPMSGLPRASAARAILPGAAPAAARSDNSSATISVFRAVSAPAPRDSSFGDVDFGGAFDDDALADDLV